jgi:hypothetical protein
MPALGVLPRFGPIAGARMIRGEVNHRQTQPVFGVRDRRFLTTNLVG